MSKIRNKFRQVLIEVLNEQIIIEAKAEGLSDAEQMKVVDNGQGGLKIEGPEKYKWVILGRRKGSGKGSRVPIQALVKWIRKKKITPTGGMSINSLAWAIQTSIYKNGIKNAVKPRPFIERAVNKTLKDFPSLEQFFK